MRRHRTLSGGGLMLIWLLMIHGCVQPESGSSNIDPDVPVEESKKSANSGESPEAGGKQTGSGNEGSKTGTESPEGGGEVSVSLGRIGSSGAVEPDFSVLGEFALDFTSDQGSGAPRQTLELGETLTVTLSPGVWRITASGLLNPGNGGAPLAVIQGSAETEVKRDGSGKLSIPLDTPLTGGEETGSLSGSVDFPRNLVKSAEAAIALIPDKGSPVPKTTVDLLKSGGLSLTLSPGLYRVDLSLLSGYSRVSRTELVRIYPRMETKLPRQSLTEGDFSQIPEFSDPAALKGYLASLPENTPNTPYPVSLSGFDLSSGENSGNTLKTLCAALEKNKYTRLDLQNCRGNSLVSVTTSNAVNRGYIVSLVLPRGVTEIGSNGFSGYTALVSVEAPGVRRLGAGAFKQCAALKSAVMPELREILDAKDADSGAFSGCAALASVSFPNLETIGNYAFAYCRALASLTIPSAHTIGSHAFRECEALVSVEAPEARTLGAGAFRQCANLGSLTMPELTVIQNGSSTSAGATGAFSDCAALVSVSLPKLETLGNYAFAHCGALVSLAFPAAQAIGSSAFRGAGSLTTIELPQAASIGSNGFTDCVSLSRVILGGIPPKLGSSVFPGDLPPESIAVPQEAVAVYQTTTEANWTRALKNKVIGLPE